MVLLISLRIPSINVTEQLLDPDIGPTYGGKSTGTMVQIRRNFIEGARKIKGKKMAHLLPPLQSLYHKPVTMQER